MFDFMMQKSHLHNSQDGCNMIKVVNYFYLKGFAL